MRKPTDADRFDALVDNRWIVAKRENGWRVCASSIETGNASGVEAEVMGEYGATPREAVDNAIARQKAINHAIAIDELIRNARDGDQIQVESDEDREPAIRAARLMRPDVEISISVRVPDYSEARAGMRARLLARQDARRKSREPEGGA